VVVASSNFAFQSTARAAALSPSLMPQKRPRHSNSPPCLDGCGLDCAHDQGTQDAGFSCPYEQCGSRCATQRTFITHLNTNHTNHSSPRVSVSARSVERSLLSPCATFSVPINAPLSLNQHPLWLKDSSARLEVLLVRHSSVLVSASRHCPSHSQPIVPPPL
jgi:hypothetical protein